MARKGALKADVVERLVQQNPGRLATKTDEFLVTAQEHRTQRQNREVCIAKFFEMVETALLPPKTRVMRVTLGTVTKTSRRDEKRQRSSVKANRGRVSDW